MKILCIDTSSNLCSVAIMDNQNLIKKTELNNGLTHSETLMPLIKDILNSTNLSLSNINLLAVDIGPGSFTGLRIGIATVKAFADSLNIPCVGVSSLEILAYNNKNKKIICSTLDCKNNNCYFALYKFENDIYTILEKPQASSYENVITLLNTNYSNYEIEFVGDILPFKSLNISSNFNDLINSFECNSNYLNIENLGIISYKKFNSNPNLNEEILPLYLKKPQAQKQLEEKLNNQNL